MSKFDDHIDLMRDLAKNAENMDPHWTYSRRNFLKSGVAAAAMVGMPFALGSKAAHAARLPYSPDYGPLMPVNDEVTGLPLLQLPEGFKYWSYGWTGDLMNDGVATPGAHDGMAVVAADANRIVLVRNHEQGSSTSGHYMPGSKGIYDPRCNGGTTTLVFAPQQKKWLSSWASLSGLIRPCAGGPTPWNTWLSCEETSNGLHNGASKQHGYVFEVPASGIASGQPLIDMGCFSHEAAAVDPVTGMIYETEDSTPSGLYRFVPNVPGRLSAGGKLQMMKLKTANNASIAIEGQNYGYFDTALENAIGTTWDVEWVDIENPDKPFISGTTYGGVRSQGLVQGASSLRRGEGIWYGNGVIYVCSTSGGAANNGQIFAYDPRRETFTLLFVSMGDGIDGVDSPDNIAWSPRGSLILCEDGGASPQQLRGLTLDGTIFPFCATNMDFRVGGTIGPVTRPSGRTFNNNALGNEWAGATFHNEWLFANAYGAPGITFAITGPWDNGAL
ncbi:PhoX family protein [Methyloversatilis discipulorum]|jgi:uncharacterized protein|uniref:PhoX family protein n=1 Tax=Methyloversatilis discipulorum TaxID=1119528 RepID=UPI003AF7D173